MLQTGSDSPHPRPSAARPHSIRPGCTAWAQPGMAGRAHLKPKTLSSYRSLHRTRVLPRWAEVPLKALTHADAVAWVADMRASGLSASRTRQAYHLLTSMLEDAV